MKNSLKIVLVLGAVMATSQVQADVAGVVSQIGGGAVEAIRVLDTGVRIFNDMKQAKEDLPKLMLELKDAKAKLVGPDYPRIVAGLIKKNNDARTPEEKLQVQAEMMAVFVATFKSFDENLKLVMVDILSRILGLVEKLPKVGEKMKVTSGGQPVKDPMDLNEDLTKSRQLKNAVTVFGEFVKIFSGLLPQLTKTAAAVGTEAAVTAGIAAAFDTLEKAHVAIDVAQKDAAQKAAITASKQAAAIALTSAGADARSISENAVKVKKEADEQAKQEAEALHLDN